MAGEINLAVIRLLNDKANDMNILTFTPDGEASPSVGDIVSAEIGAMKTHVYGVVIMAVYYVHTNDDMWKGLSAVCDMEPVPAVDVFRRYHIGEGEMP